MMLSEIRQPIIGPNVVHCVPEAETWLTTLDDNICTVFKTQLGRPRNASECKKSEKSKELVNEFASFVFAAASLIETSVLELVSRLTATICDM